MKRVTENKYKYSIKDSLRWLGIILMHFIGFYAYIMILLGVHYATKGGEFVPHITELNWGLIYAMSLAPIVSGILHIIYAEKGITNLKAMLWLHALAVAILVPAIIFITG